MPLPRQESQEPQRLQGALELTQMNQQLRFTRSLPLQAPFPAFIIMTSYSGAKGSFWHIPVSHIPMAEVEAALAQLAPASTHTRAPSPCTAPRMSSGVCPVLEVGLVFFLLLIQETAVAKKGRSSQSSQHSMLHTLYKKEKKVVFLSVSKAVPKTI